MKLNIYLKILLVFIISIFIVGCNRYDKFEVSAKVISINDNILESMWIGDFLSSSSGYLKSDINKVGIQFDWFENEVFTDLKLLHSEISQIKKDNIIKLILKVDNGFKINKILYADIYINGRRVLTSEMDLCYSCDQLQRKF